MQESVDKKFSIITPTYQRTESLRKAIQSVINQDYQNYEMLICSEGYSSDDEECVNSFNDKRLFYHHIEKQSFKNWGNVQRNEMLKKCTGDYIIWLDDDNEIYSDYLSFANGVVNSESVLSIFKIDFPHHHDRILPVTNDIIPGFIDTLNYMVRKDIAMMFEWENIYAADFVFINEIKNYCNQNGIEIHYFDKIIGIHNIRPEVKI